MNILPAAIEAVRARGGLVIAQLNPHMPYTYGDGVLACDVVDYAIEVDEPLTALTADDGGRRQVQGVGRTCRPQSLPSARRAECGTGRVGWVLSD